MVESMKVGVVFASYNRKSIALECVNRLMVQTRLPDLVVIADNASSDGSSDALRSLSWDRLTVIEADDNLGNAGAVKIAMEQAFDEGCELVWILDDDSWPREDALKNLLKDYSDPQKTVRHPIQIEPSTGKFTWPLQCIRENGGVTLVDSIDALPKAECIWTRGVWTGALISKEVREKVGPVNGELFIRGEDEEYPWRFEKNGIREQVIPDSVLDHPGPSNIASWSFFGRKLFIEPGLQPWKVYYKVRNMVWLKRQQSGAFAGIAISLAYAFGLVRIDGFYRMRIWWQAVKDGWLGNLGRKDFTS